jgi:hypothetical protein
VPKRLGVRTRGGGARDPAGAPAAAAVTVQRAQFNNGRVRMNERTSNEMESTTAESAAQPARSPAPKLQPLEFLLIVGLAGVFLVNALVALLQPSDFTGLLGRSVVGRVIPTMGDPWVAYVIAVHDFTIGLALLATIRIPRTRPFVLAWAGAWLLVVTLVKLTALEAIGG